MRFTVPAAGTYTFTGDFMQLTDRVRVAPWEAAVVSTGGSTLTPVSGYLGGWRGQVVPIDFTQSLVPGDTVDFIVWANGDNWGDDIGLKLDVTAVPEPAAWSFLSCLGLAVVGCAMKFSRYPLTRAALHTSPCHASSLR